MTRHLLLMCWRERKEKTVAFDNGRLYLTTHRLIYLDGAEPQKNSRYLDLHVVKQTEYWVGFLKSSPKVTLVLSDASDGQTEQDILFDDESLHPLAQTWSCHVCGYRNQATSGIRCGLCGIVKTTDTISAPVSGSGTPVTETENKHTSLISISETGALISCPSCTFLNHSSMMRCEVCESPLSSLPLKASRPATPVSRQPTPSLGSPAIPTSVRLSFRKGGDKVFYTALKKALQAKEWDISRQNGRRKAAPYIGNSELDSFGHRTTTVGIGGILKTIDLDAREKEDDMQEALANLETLMARAKDMVTRTEETIRRT